MENYSLIDPYYPEEGFKPLSSEEFNGMLQDVPQLVEQSAIMSAIPSRDDYHGPFNFTLTFDEIGKHWVYSDLLQQLFIDMDKILIMQFQLSPEIWSDPMRFYIVAMPVYSTDENINIPVRRCTLHTAIDDPQGQAHQQEDQCLCGPSNNYAGHVLRVNVDDAFYKFDPKSKRHSVGVLVTPPQIGSQYITIPYSFACKTSCSKGMQRRPILVIFTLEDELGNVYGRQKVGVKICSCPKRDKKRQEDDYLADVGGGEKKRKRPMTGDHAGPPDPYADNLAPVKKENIDPIPLENEVAAIIKHKCEEVRKMISGFKDYLAECENKINEISELNDRLNLSN